MDPVAAIAIINDQDELTVERRYALSGLALWISRGGAIPFDADTIVESDWLDRELIAAVNVAMVNADLSGLEGLGYAV